MKERHFWGISGGEVSFIGATHISLAYDTLFMAGLFGSISSCSIFSFVCIEESCLPASCTSSLRWSANFVYPDRMLYLIIVDKTPKLCES